MNIAQLTPGAGRMYCGNCLRDNALVAELRRMGHDAFLLPLYTPLTLDERDESAGHPIFYSGINVFLDEKSLWFRKAPTWLHRLLSLRGLLSLAARDAANTQPALLGELTLSMLRGEAGNQARELDDLVRWFKNHGRPHVICLSNALLLGLARRLRNDLGSRVVCMLQGEDAFLDSLPPAHRMKAWLLLGERATDVDQFVAASRYFADLMSRHMSLPHDRVRVVPNGIQLEGYGETRNAECGTLKETESSQEPLDATRNTQQTAPRLGFLARMSREKGLDTLVDAYLLLRQRGSVPELKLRVAGGCGPSDKAFVAAQRKKLATAGALADVEFLPNLDREAKIAFLKSLAVFSVPALYGESFGLYVIEAMAAGVPVVQPNTAAFPEILQATGGGLLCEPGDVQALAHRIEELLKNPVQARAIGEAGRKAAFDRFSVNAMAHGMMRVFDSVVG